MTSEGEVVSSGGGSGAKSSALMRGSMFSAALNSVFAVMFGVVTFGLNGFVLRHVSKATLGLINVRLILFNNTVLFFSRECFRKACLKQPQNHKEWKSVINLIWTVVPLTATISATIGYVWVNFLEMPEDPELASQYPTSVALIGLAVTMEAFNEVFWIIAQMFLFVKFRSSMEFLHVAGRALLVATIVVVAPEVTVVGFSAATVAVVAVQFVAFNAFFKAQIGRRNAVKKQDPASISSGNPDDDGGAKGDEYTSPLPFESLRDLYPDLSAVPTLNPDRLLLVVSFFKQGIFKQLLTEGERYMFTWFSLMSLADQGVYDVVSSFGAMAARLIFSKVEEAAYFFFSQTVSRGKAKDKAELASTSQHLHNLLRSMTLIGALVAVFGQCYSHALLHLYGGTKLSEGMGPALLRGQSFFVLLMAVNGISECFAFSSMTSKQVEKYNFTLAVMTVAFLAFSYFFAKTFGPIGFVWANCANFSMRIGYNCWLIYQRFGNNDDDANTTDKNPLWGIVPNAGTLAALAASGVVCKMSELYLYDSSSSVGVGAFLVHVGIGGVCFLSTLAQILISEPFLSNALSSFLKSKKLVAAAAKKAGKSE